MELDLKKPNKFKLNCIVAFVAMFNFPVYASVSHYHAIFKFVLNKNNQLMVATREFEKSNKKYLLVVDPRNYRTEVVASAQVVSGTLSARQRAKILQMPYLKSLTRYAQYNGRIENSGLTHAGTPVRGLFLTVDLCPSRSHFDKHFFQWLVQMSKRENKPFPVAIAMSGKWLVRHKQAFLWLLARQRKHELAITWVNHSYSHPYHSGVRKTRNFLLQRSVKIKQEILATEKLLLNYDQVPSVLFRFPGLVMNQALLKIIEKYGLIALGADAWLGRSEFPRNGSVILVHANGNEPAGLRAVKKYLNSPKHRWLAIIDALPQG